MIADGSQLGPRANPSPDGGTTRRDFLQKATKAIIGGGVLIGGLTVPMPARASPCTECNTSAHSCGAEVCETYNVCTTDECTTQDKCNTMANICQGSHTCDTVDTCVSDTCNGGTNTCLTNACTSDACDVNNSCNANN